jgi:hypothetical protein
MPHHRRADDQAARRRNSIPVRPIARSFSEPIGRPDAGPLSRPLLGRNVDSERNDAMCAFARCKNLSIKLDDETICSDESRLGTVKKMSYIRCKTYLAMLGTNNNMTAGIDPIAAIQAVFTWVVSVQFRTAFGSFDPLLSPAF